MGVDSGDNKDEGAGDQGLMFGYACDETDALMPAAICYSHKLLKDLAALRKEDPDSILGPDSKLRSVLFMMIIANQLACIRLCYQLSTMLIQHNWISVI